MNSCLTKESSNVLPGNDDDLAGPARSESGQDNWMVQSVSEPGSVSKKEKICQKLSVEFYIVSPESFHLEKIAGQTQESEYTFRPSDDGLCYEILRCQPESDELESRHGQTAIEKDTKGQQRSEQAELSCAKLKKAQ